MQINNKKFSRKEIQRRIGNLNQVGNTRHYQLTEGKSKGIKAIDFKTGSGLNFTVLPDRGLDISLADYKGNNLVFLTPNGEVNSTYYDPAGMEWLKSFFGGLLTTCGLTYLGAPGRDGDEKLGLHGRYTNIPARRVNDTSRWVEDDYILEVSGIVEESTLYGNKLRMKRTISSKAGENSLNIKDVVENFGYERSPFTILYHINAGFPLLDENSELVISAVESEPVDENSRQSMAEMKEFSSPVQGFHEQNFLHKIIADSDGYGYAAMINRNLAEGLGMYIKFNYESLPYLNEWKMIGEGDYVVGIEPCNVPCKNRGVLRKENKLKFLEPGERREMEIEIGVLEGKEEISNFQKKIKKIIES